MDLVLGWFNITFNICAIAIAIRIMFCLEDMRHTLNEMEQLMAELREEKYERLKVGKFVRSHGETDS